MELIIHDNNESFLALQPVWNELVTRSNTKSPFQRFEYLSNWWNTLGGGEWEKASELLIISGWENGALIGIAPLFKAFNSERSGELMLLGSVEISDVLDLIVPAADHDLFARAVWRLIRNDSRFPKRFDWYNLPENSPTIALFMELAKADGAESSLEVYQPSPTIPLPSDFETYLSGIDKKQRHEIRRKIRRAEESGRDVRWRMTSLPSELDPDIAELFRLMEMDPAKNAFLTPLMRQQMEHSIRAAFEFGYLQLAFLEVEGYNACVYLNFDLENKIWVYNSGYDRAYNDLSVGWVLLGYLIEYAIQLGRTEFDFLRGDEDYKFKFGAINRPVMRLSITN